jgi:hypothetical protein
MEMVAPLLQQLRIYLYCNLHQKHQQDIGAYIPGQCPKKTSPLILF